MNIPTEIQNFHLKIATLDDIPLIIHYIKKLATYERLLDKVEITEERARKFLFGDKSYAEVLLAYENETPVGFALYFHNFSTFAGCPGLYLEDIFFDPEHRGKGYGKALLRHLASLALERGCARFEWSVLDWNTPSIEFYLSLGALPMNDWTLFRMDRDTMQQLLQKK
jgi:GNAT superfamily N-acetyltransferase